MTDVNPLLEDDFSEDEVNPLLIDDDEDEEGLPDLDLGVLSVGDFSAPALVDGTDPDSVFPVNYDDYAEMDKYRDEGSDVSSGSSSDDDSLSVADSSSMGDGLEDFLNYSESFESDDFSAVGEYGDDHDGELEGHSAGVAEEDDSLGDSLESLIGLTSTVDDDGNVFHDFEDDDEDDEERYYTLRLDEIITRAIDIGASDIDIAANDEVSFSILGNMKRIPEFGILNYRQVSNAYEDITSHVNQDTFIQDLELDTSYEVRSGKYAGRRLRLNVAKSFDTIVMTFRVISNSIPSPEELGIDERLLKWIDMPTGLVLVNGSTGQGKKLRYDTKVPTPTGWSTMGELRVGDQVYDSNMNTCNVEWISELDRSPELYKLSFKDGQTVFADADHQWIVSSAKSREYSDNKNFKGFKEVSCLRTMTTRDMLDEGIVLYNDKNCSDYNFAVPVVESERSIQSNIELPLDPYVFGAWLSDEVFDFDNDEENLTAILESMDLNNNVYIPYVYLTASHEQRMGLLKGLMDTSDCVESDGVYELSFSNKQLAVDVSSLVRSLGFCVEVSFDGSDDVLCAERYRVSFSTNDDKWNYIVSIDKVEKDDLEYGAALCIGVDSPDHSYLCADYVVTHNSTTLASLIREIQLRYPKKVITVEKPVEYVYGVTGRAVVHQREVGRDTKSFGAGLDSAMRQHPDVILIGEVRNKEEAEALLYASDTGHLAFSTMHTNSAADTLNRIKRMFSGDEQIRVLGDLSESARGFVNQLLVPAPDGKSRFAVREVLDIEDEDVKDLIRHGNVRGLRDYQMEHEITMEHELLKAVLDGSATPRDAYNASPNRPRMTDLFKKHNIDL